MPADDRAVELTRAAAAAAASKKGEDLLAFDVTERNALTDVFLLVTGHNERQISAIVDEIEKTMLEHGQKVRREGLRQSRWVLLDCLDVVVHVQHDDERAYYDLERLWRDCPRIELSEAPLAEDGLADVEQ